MLSLAGVMPEPRVDRARRILVEWALLVAFGLWFLFTRSYIEDDAFIHLEFAKNVDEGRGFAFDGRPVFGDSSPLWVFALVLFGKLGLDLEVAAKLLACFGCAFYVASVRRLCERFPERGARVWTYTAITFGVTLNPYVMTWVFSGMESVTAAAFATWAVAAVFDDDGSASKRVLTVVGCTAAGALLRFEIALLGLSLLAELCMNASFRKTSRTAHIARFAVAGALALTPLVVFLVYAKFSLGSFVPTSNLAKRVAGPSWIMAWLEATQRLAGVLVLGYGAPLMAAVVCVGRAWPGWRDRTVLQDRALRLALGWAVGLCVFYVLNRTVVQTRYLLLLTPSVIVILITALRFASAQDDRRPLKAAVGLIVASTLYLNFASVLPFVLVKDRYVARIEEFTLFLQTKLDPTWPIAIYSIGQVAYRSPQPIVDIGGLMRPSVLSQVHGGDLREMVAWSKTQGARCFAPGDPQDSEQTLVYDEPIPDVTRTVTPWVTRPDMQLQLRCLRSQ